MNQLLLLTHVEPQKHVDHYQGQQGRDYHGPDPFTPAAEQITKAGETTSQPEEQPRQHQHALDGRYGFWVEGFERVIGGAQEVPAQAKGVR